MSNSSDNLPPSSIDSLANIIKQQFKQTLFIDNDSSAPQSANDVFKPVNISLTIANFPYFLSQNTDSTVHAVSESCVIPTKNGSFEVQYHFNLTAVNSSDQSQKKAFASIKLFIKCDAVERELYGQLSMSIIDKNNTERNTKLKNVKIFGNRTVEWNNFITAECLLDEKNELLVDDKLTLLCKIETSNSVTAKQQNNLPKSIEFSSDQPLIVQKHEHKWVFANLPKYLELYSRIKQQIEIESAYFASPISDHIQFKLKLIILEHKYASIRLVCDFWDQLAEVKVHFKISVLNEKGDDYCATEATQLFSEEHSEFDFDCLAKLNCSDFDDPVQCLVNNIAVVKMELNMHLDEEFLAKHAKMNHFVIDDFRSPWKFKQICDVLTQSEMQAKLNVHDSSHQWTIDNFLGLAATNPYPYRPNVINFPPFSQRRYDAVQFTIQLYPNDQGTMKINIFLNSTEIVNVIVRFRLSLQDEQYQKTCMKEKEIFLPAKGKAEWKEYSLSRDIISNDNMMLLHRGTDLRICFDIELYLDPISSLIELPSFFLMKSLNKLASKQMPTDIVLHFGEANVNLYAHKVILSARSGIFRAMFSNEFIENQQNQVKVNDVDVETFRELLQYVYTEQVLQMDELATELLIASDMYDISDLKSKTESYLSEHVTYESAINLYELSDFYHAHHLKSNVMKYIHEHIDILADTEQFRTFITQKPDLLLQLYLNINENSTENKEKKQKENHFEFAFD